MIDELASHDLVGWVLVTNMIKTIIVTAAQQRGSLALLRSNFTSRVTVAKLCFTLETTFALWTRSWPLGSWQESEKKALESRG